MSDQQMVIEVIGDIKNILKRLDTIESHSKKTTDHMAKGVDSLSATWARYGLAIQGVQNMMMTAQKAYDIMLRPAAELEEAMLGVQKTTGMTNEEIAELRGQVVKLSYATGESATNLAKIGEIGGQLGIKGVENLSAFIRTTSMMVKTTDLSVEESASRIAQLANIYEQPITQIEKLGDVINELSNNTSAGARDIVEGVRRIGKSGQELGFSFADMAGISATLKEMGIDAERGGTAVRNIMIRMQTQSEQIARDMGITQTEWNKMLSNDGKHAMMAYLETLKGMDQIARSQSISKVFGQEGFLAVNSLSGATEMLTENMKMANDQFEQGGSLQAEFTNIMQGMIAQAGRVWQRIKGFSIEMGGTVIPLVTRGLKSLADNFQHIWTILPGLTGAWIAYNLVLKQNSLSLLLAAKNTKIYRIALVLLRRGLKSTMYLMRNFKAALMSTGIGVVIILVSELIAYLMRTDNVLTRIWLNIQKGMGWIQKMTSGYSTMYEQAVLGLEELDRQALQSSEEYQQNELAKAEAAQVAADEIKSTNQALEDYLNSERRVGLEEHKNYLEKKLALTVNETAKERLAYEKLRDKIADIEKQITEQKREESEKRINITLSRVERLSSVITDEALDAYMEQAAIKAQETNGIIQEAWLKRLDILRSEKEERSANQAQLETELLAMTALVEQRAIAEQRLVDSKALMSSLIQSGFDLNSTEVQQAEYNLALAQAKVDAIDQTMQKRKSEFSLGLGLEEKLIKAKQSFARMNQALQAKGMLGTLKDITMGTISAGVNAVKSAASLPFPVNLLAIGGTMATIIAAISKIKGFAGTVTAFAKGGIGPNKPFLSMMHEDFQNTGLEIVTPVKTFREILHKEVMPHMQATVNADLNNAGIENRLDELNSRMATLSTDMATKTGEELAGHLRGQL